MSFPALYATVFLLQLFVVLFYFVFLAVGHTVTAVVEAVVVEAVAVLADATYFAVFLALL